MWTILQNEVTVFQTVERGGFIEELQSEEIENLNTAAQRGLSEQRGGTPCTNSFDNLYIYDFVTPAFITLIKDHIHGSNYYYFQLDEYYTDEDKWKRQLGTAYATENTIYINETDGSEGVISLNSDGTLTLYRARSEQRVQIEGEKLYYAFVQAGQLLYSSIQQRNETIGCLP